MFNFQQSVVSPSPVLSEHRLVVALVEDDAALRDELQFQLQHLGFDVVAFADAYGLYRYMATQRVAAVVLDIGLPGEDGLSIARLLRAHDAQLGLVFVTARVQRSDRLAGLQAGADAYLIKPVDVDELALLLHRLLARLNLLRKPEPEPETQHDQIHAEHWKLFPERALLVSPLGTTLRLTVVEMQLLTALVKGQGKPVRLQMLARSMGLAEDEWHHHRMEVVVSRLRAKVERHTGLKAPVRTVRCEGYAWAADEPPTPL